MIRFISVSLLALAAFLLAGTPSVKFQDVTEKAGLKALIIAGGEKKNYVLEVNGSGACWFDYNNDGYMDLYLVNGATLAELQGKKPVQSHRNYLFRNNRNGTFTDVTEAAHVPGSGWGFGCVAADYDNDGNSDLFIANFGPNILY
ncbi:MAG: VCBS repeat-containing protein, partial [Acidobacteriota bacterium]|nr:VCBS repeat-containing protein [Acidobacteriota bacterium]